MALGTVFVCAASVGIYTIRRPILQAAGWALVVNERLAPAEVIVVAVDAKDAGVLEAADLVRSGTATHVAVFSVAPDAIENEFARRGIPYEGATARSIRQLRELGIESIDLIPGDVAGTEDEGPVLAAWCQRRGFRSVVVVTSSDHSRRLRRVLHRSMGGLQTSLTIRCARHSLFDPTRWWEGRGGARIEVEELEKLMLDVLRHPIS